MIPYSNYISRVLVTAQLLWASKDMGVQKDSTVSGVASKGVMTLHWIKLRVRRETGTWAYIDNLITLQSQHHLQKNCLETDSIQWTYAKDCKSILPWWFCTTHHFGWIVVPSDCPSLAPKCESDVVFPYITWKDPPGWKSGFVRILLIFTYKHSPKNHQRRWEESECLYCTLGISTSHISTGLSTTSGPGPLEA